MTQIFLLNGLSCDCWNLATNIVRSSSDIFPGPLLLSAVRAVNRKPGHSHRKTPAARTNNWEAPSSTAFLRALTTSPQRALGLTLSRTSAWVNQALDLASSSRTRCCCRLFDDRVLRRRVVEKVFLVPGRTNFRRGNVDLIGFSMVRAKLLRNQSSLLGRIRHPSEVACIEASSRTHPTRRRPQSITNHGEYLNSVLSVMRLQKEQHSGHDFKRGGSACAIDKSRPSL